MQCTIFYFLIVYVSIEQVWSKLISTPYLTDIRADYCDKLNELKHDTNCEYAVDKDSGMKSIHTTDYNIELLWSGGLRLDCIENVQNITLVQLTVVNAKLKYFGIDCDLDWPINDFMRLLNIYEVDECNKLYIKNQYNVWITEKFVSLSHGTRNLSLEINSLPSIPSKNLSLFRHYSNVTTLELTTTIDGQITSDFFTSFFPNLKEITIKFEGFCLPIQQMLNGLKQLQIINLYIINEDRVSERRNVINPKLMNCKELNFTNMNQLRKVSLNDQRNKDQKLNSKFSFTVNLLRGVKNLEIFEVIGLNLFSLPELIFKDQQRLSTLIIRDINCLSNGRKTDFNDCFKFLRSPTLMQNLEYFTLFQASTLDPVAFYNIFDIYSIPFLEYSKLKILELDAFFRGSLFLSLIKSFVCFDKEICLFGRDINDNECPFQCTCKLIRSSMKFIINCNTRLNNSIPNLPIPRTGIPTLLIEANEFVTLPTVGSLYGYENLRELHIANNNLTKLSIAQLPPNITYLDISNNNLETLDEEVMSFLSQRDQLGLKLSGNLWRCDCNEKPLLEFVKNMASKIDDLADVYCSNKNLGLLINLQMENICFPRVKYLTIFLGLLFLLTTIIIICLINKKRLQICLYEHNICFWWITREELDKDKIFDAFLAFSHKDIEKVPEFIDKLENGPRKFNLCYYDRNWQIGVPIPESICKSIEDSKRIIILFTKHFLESSWGRFEFRLDIQATSRDKCKRLIVIRYPDVESIDDLDSELKNYMTLNTYLDRNDANFWNKLIYTMPHNSRTLQIRGTNDPQERVAETRLQTLRTGRFGSD